MLRTLFRIGGINPRSLLNSFRGVLPFWIDLIRFRSLDHPAGMEPSLSRLFPCYSDRYMSAGTAKGHYFHQDLWCARRIYELEPIHHVDVGSRVDGFISHLLVFRSVTVVDVRPLDEVDGLTFRLGDITAMPFEDGTLPSLSCLHVVEHIGLGRYGDVLDPNGWVKALSELSRVIESGGRLYIGVPVGKESLYFHAHRVFAPKTIIDALPDFELESFGLVDDDGELVTDCGPYSEAIESTLYGCGLFEFVKKL